MNPRPWTPTAPTLLWAHEVRRENIHLSDQLESTRASLTTTTTTTNALQQTVAELHSLVQDVSTENRRLADKLDRVADESAQRVERLNRRVEVLEGENGVLRERLDEVGRVVAEGVWDVKMQVLGEIRGMMGRLEKGGLGLMDPANDNHVSANAKSPDLIPDSMPVDDGIPSTTVRLDRSVRESSETTFGDSTRVDELETRDSAVLPAMKQDGRSLAGYLSFAEGIRGDLPPRKREGLIVEMFLDGLDDAAIRIMLETRLDRAGWAWDVMSACLRGLVEKQQVQAPDRERQARDGPFGGDKAAAKGTNGGTAKRRKKRCIPIEPASDENTPTLASS